jgi:signal transduction histidine kinase
MTTLTQVLKVNWIILYFVYGQVFFITGLVTGLQWRRRSSLEFAHPLPWLAAFGIAHGLNEWGYIFIPLQAIYLDPPVVRLMMIAHLLLLAVSFFFLFQFGVELVLPIVPQQRWLRALPALALLVWGAAVFVRGTVAGDSLNELMAVGDGWARYLLCFPGALLASIGLFRQSRQLREIDLPRIAFYVTGAACAFAVYALFGGLVVPTTSVPPGNWLNYSLLDRTVQIPAPVFRSLCGLAMAFFVVRSLEVFQVEDDRRIADMEQAQILAADRERIGRELHDGTIQKIYAAGLGLEEARFLVDEDPGRARRQIQTVMNALNGTIEDIRRYIFDLRAQEPTLELETVLAELVQDLRLDTLLEVDLEVSGERCCLMSPQAVEHVTQVAREALSNVVQHAKASHVTVSLAYLGHSTRLTVADNGKGLDTITMIDGPPDAYPGGTNGDQGSKVTAYNEDEAPLISGAHHGRGLANMQARARLLGGELTVENRPGQGLTLVLTVPCGSSKPSGQLLAEPRARL